MQHILKEIEQKAPIIQKQREDYEQMLNRHNSILAQLDVSQKDSDSLRAQLHNSHKEITSLKQGKK